MRRALLAWKLHPCPQRQRSEAGAAGGRVVPWPSGEALAVPAGGSNWFCARAELIETPPLLCSWALKRIRRHWCVVCCCGPAENLLRTRKMCKQVLARCLIFDSKLVNARLTGACGPRARPTTAHQLRGIRQQDWRRTWVQWAQQRQREHGAIRVAEAAPPVIAAAWHAPHRAGPAPPPCACNASGIAPAHLSLPLCCCCSRGAARWPQQRPRPAISP